MLQHLHIFIHNLQQVMNSPGEELTGKLAVVHQFVDMPAQVVSKYDPVARTFDSVRYALPWRI